MIYLGADHRGFHLKKEIAFWLTQWGLPFEDLGSQEIDPDDDYTDIAVKVAEKVAQHEDKAVGILICGSGIGMDIAANRFKKIRSGLGFSSQQVKAGREDDDINVLSLPADFLSHKKAKKIVAMFLKTEFSEKERYKRRIKKVSQLGG